MLFFSEKVCHVERPCRNETSEPGICKDYCDYNTEYEISDADTCNGENCSCCAMKGIVFTPKTIDCHYLFYYCSETG